MTESADEYRQKTPREALNDILIILACSGLFWIGLNIYSGRPNSSSPTTPPAPDHEVSPSPTSK